MPGLFLLMLVAITSVGAFWIGCGGFRLHRRGIVRAMGGLLEVMGISLIFFVLNLVVGIAAVFGLRFLTGRYVSLYLPDDALLPILSLFQGLTFYLWRCWPGGRDPV